LPRQPYSSLTGAGIRPNAAFPISARLAGLVTRNRPIPFDEFVAALTRERAGAGAAMEPTLPPPNRRGHRALAALYKPARSRIVTPDIDNLDQVSGLRPRM